jgi:hypothetical protein
MSNTGHGNHWECLGGTADERIAQFLPIVIAKGNLDSRFPQPKRARAKPRRAEKVIVALTHPATPLACMVLLRFDSSRKRSHVISGFPYAHTGARQRLKITEIQDWGNQAEGVLLAENVPHEQPIGLFNPGFYLDHAKYKAGEEYDFKVAGLIYRAECANDATVTVTDQDVLRQRHAALNEQPELLPDGSIAPQVVHLGGLTAFLPGEKYEDDAEFYCIVDTVSEIDLEGIRVFQIAPRVDEENRHSPIPGVIYAAAAVFKNGYVPIPGDTISGFMWVRGYLERGPPCEGVGK